jgi:ribosomal protein L11 methyltransferase
VLAIAAAKLGYGPVLALDNDPLSVEAIDENAHGAGVAAQAHLFDLRSQPLPLGEAGEAARTLVLANLLRPLLLEMAGAIVEPPPHLIASGLLGEEADEIARVYAERFDLRERERRTRGDWAVLWLIRR